MTNQPTGDPFVIEKFYKTRILVFIICYLLIMVVFISLFVFVPNFNQLTDPSLSMEVRVAAAENILDGHRSMWPALILLIILMGGHFYIIFNRFIGPLYRISETHQKIASGDLREKVTLRKADYLTRERDEINRMLSVLREKIGTAQETNKLSLEILEKPHKRAARRPSETAETMPDDIQKLHNLQKKMHETLGFFNLGTEDKI